MDGRDESADGRILKEVLLHELDEPQRTILDHLLQVDCGCTVLQFIYARPREWLTAQDIAFHLQAPSSCVESTLQALIQLGMAERREIADLVFYGLGAPASHRPLADAVCEWQSRWQAALGRLHDLLGGRAGS